ncbi:hypothetical protein BJ973_009738 [Actinoplanes tereljensis]
MRYQQLQLFDRSTTTALRDRTKAHSYSPEKDEFRRDHERGRRWWLPRRYAWKRCRSQGCSRECGELGLHDEAEAVPPLIWPEEATCLQRPSSVTLSRDVPADRDVSPGDEQSTGRSALAGQEVLPDRVETVPCAEPEHPASAAAQSESALGEEAAAGRRAGRGGKRIAQAGRPGLALESATSAGLAGWAKRCRVGGGGWTGGVGGAGRAESARRTGPFSQEGLAGRGEQPLPFDVGARPRFGCRSDCEVGRPQHGRRRRRVAGRGRSAARGPPWPMFGDVPSGHSLASEMPPWNLCC